MMDALLGGNLIPLPTANEGNPGDTLTQDSFDEFRATA